MHAAALTPTPTLLITHHITYHITFTIYNCQTYTHIHILYTLTDLQGVSGVSHITVPGRGETLYQLNFCPPFGGTFTGSLTFNPTTTATITTTTNAIGSATGAAAGAVVSSSSGSVTSATQQQQQQPAVAAVWYTVEVRATGAAAESEIVISTPLRTAAGIEISLTNPCNAVLQFEVLLAGAGVIGEPTFSLKPLETAIYTLYYTPVKVGVHSGSVTFANETVGESWYKLQLEALEAPPVELELQTAPIGSCTSCTVEVENPCGTPVQVEVVNSNKRNFSITPQRLQLQPYSTAHIEVVYTPSSIGELESAELQLKPLGKNAPIGVFEYTARGRGELPGVMPEHR
jgi:Abnormal spindle-like microcephaly-assoc'd, ASPM-SPD-2-Hydin